MANKVGILTWHYYSNYGSGLQAYALQELIKSLGYDVRIINYRDPKFGKSVWWKDLLKDFINNTIGLFNYKIYEKTHRGVYKYQKKYLKQTNLISTPEEIPNLVREYSCLVYGSDQIWAPNVYNPIYMGGYIPQGIRKISYAASIGLNEIPDNLITTYKQNLSSFYAIAVREQEGKELLKSNCQITADVVLDPTLMINAISYKKMQKPVKGVKGKFIYCYFLNKEHKYRQKVEEYAREKGLQIIGTSEKPSDSQWMKRVVNLGADQFLWLINNAETIFTDSYHGSIFSLLFHKNLWTFVRFEENSPICQNSRIRQLQNNFNIGHRIITTNHTIDDSLEIDYEYFERALEKHRADSLKYIKEALK